MHKFISLKSIKFLLYEVLDVEALTHYPLFQEHGREIFDLILETGMKIGQELLFPCFAEMDKKPPRWADGEVTSHPAVGELMRACGEGGWIGAEFPVSLGGQQIPSTVMTSFRFILAAANLSAAVHPFLTAGAAHLILSFGEKALAATYAEPMLAGQWQGTMALTEPQAGSSLADLMTTAYPTDHDYYQLHGQKIFISCAEYQVENVVHLLLARIEGAPEGVKGISLFVVPKRRVAGSGQLVLNDVQCTALYHKLGYRGAPLTQLSFGDNDDCRAWLVGEPHQGLRYMFQMMNEARVDVGMLATASAVAAYYAALDYCLNRPQGRPLGVRHTSTPQVPIVEHADVKRMLLFQRAIGEGSLALVLQCAKYLDLAKVATGEEKERLELLLDLLTPVAKTYPSEMAVQSISAGLQCLGGYGYCDEFLLEQYYRDVRIHPIHEGTTGIQGLDLLGRKVMMKEGQAFTFFLHEVRQSIQRANAITELQAQAQVLSTALDQLEQVTAHLLGLARRGQLEHCLADATLYIELFGIIAVAWQWLQQAIIAQEALISQTPTTDVPYLEGKLYTFRYFFAYELPKSDGLIRRLRTTDGLTVTIRDAHFVD